MVFNLKRKFGYYIIVIYIPCILLVAVSWLSFWLDPKAIPARVSIGVTTLLVMTTLVSNINASLPRVSYIRAIDIWSAMCLLFVFIALLEFSIVHYVGRHEAKNVKTDNNADESGMFPGNTNSKKVDIMFRIFFPIMFTLFSIFYWTTFLY